MSQITEQEFARGNWFKYRAQEYLLKRAEALGFEDNDDEVGLVHAWQFIMIEAEKLAPVDLERYGGEEFKSFMSQDISVLIDKYPHLLLHARMGLKRQKEDRERKEQKKRKLEESAGGSAAGGSAGVDAMETALLQARPGPCPRTMSLMYQKRIESLMKRKLDLETEVAESRAQNEEFKQEIEKLKGKRLDLPPHELDELLAVVTETIRKISDTKNLEAVKLQIEGMNKFCCPLSTGLYERPVVAPDGYTYEKDKIEQWIQVQLEQNEIYDDRRGKWLSPKTGVLLTSRLLVPNFDIKSLMEEEIHERLVEMRAKKVSR
jgi:hypothetical protein